MERVADRPGGRTLFDVATRTTAPIVVTGSSRADLKIVSGSFVIDHKVAGYKVTLTADNLAWTSSCNCASSGTLTGMVSGRQARRQDRVGDDHRLRRGRRHDRRRDRERVRWIAARTM